MSSLIKSGVVIGFFTLCSRISGYVRDILMASYLGTSAAADAFNIAFKLPNFFRNIFAEGALSSAFIPIFTDKIVKENKNEAINFGSNILSILLIVLIVITFFFEIFMPAIMKVLAIGFSNDHAKFQMAISLSRITFPYLLFISIITIFTGAINSFGKFAVASAIPILLNICMICAACSLSSYIGPAYSFAAGVFIAGIAQFIMIFYFARLYKIKLKIVRPKIDNDTKMFFKKMLPAILGSSTTQINLWIGTVIATKIERAVSILYFAERLNQFPLAIIGTALGTILLPTLTKDLKSQDYNKANITQNIALQISLSLTIPCSIALISIAYPVIEVLFERNSFTSKDTFLVSSALQMLAIGLPAFVMIRIFTPRFFANFDTKTPVFVSFIGMVVNLALSFLLMKDYFASGIAFASSISGWICCLLLIILLIKNHNFAFYKSSWKILLKVVFASLIMLLVLEICKNFIYFYPYESLGSKIFKLILIVFLGGVSYLSIAYKLIFPDIKKINLI